MKIRQRLRRIKWKLREFHGVIWIASVVLLIITYLGLFFDSRLHFPFHLILSSYWTYCFLVSEGKQERIVNLALMILTWIFFVVHMI